MRQLNQSELGSVAGGCLCFWSWFSWCKPAPTCTPKPATCTPAPTCGTPTTPPPQPN